MKLRKGKGKRAGLRKLGTKPGEFRKDGFQLPNFTEENL